MVDQLTALYRSMPLMLYFAWGDTKARYRRSVLGPFWLVIGTAVGVVGLSFLWGGLLKVDRATLVPTLAIGIVVWQFIAGCVAESPSAFTRNAAVMRNLKIPYLIFPLQLMLRQLINFVHNLVVVVVVLIIFPPPLGATQILIIPGVLLLIGNLLWIIILFGMLGARFRDLEQTIAVLVPLMFFLTPVLYRPEQLGAMEKFAWLNPFTYMISLVRDPIQGFAPAPFVYLISAGMLLVGWWVTFWLYSRRHSRIPFWV
ncbi:ABC transporter permease [Candidatus Desulfobacillus denitrificans]|jgi:ABC-type polysaccharide/polyol phosphate export permease|uniref:ABC transporter permease n=1 Tax=Candidatus Desulfobacillus denitrificans TaxID=2608985 RepID=A0A809RTM5_9PROT|nr:ABC transporter permease [Candidatus Desulfobacillus denitrificans]GIK45768.1 MAG: putative O-antigen/lipopolysaccharide transport integral membrane protein ABC transporter RfbD [Betaproteobacteria bacterium]